jgi:hypothetical protein
MARRIRKPLLATLPIALVVLLGIVLLPGSPARKSTPGPGCNNPSDSALNQYCDPVPASTGAHAPHVGQEALAAVLPAQLVNRIRRMRGGARRSLLSLPAPGPRHALRGETRAASVASLSTSMIVVLVALTVALAGLALVRARTARQRHARSRHK